MGTSWISGPQFTDNYGARRAPSPWQLIEKYKSLVFAMVSRNEKGVCRVPLRLYYDGGKDPGGTVGRLCNPGRITRSTFQHLFRAGLVSNGSVDKVQEVRTHPVLDRLDRPDPYGYFNRNALLSLISRYNDTVGSAYLYPEGAGWGNDQRKSGRREVPDWIWVLYSQYVLPVRQAASPLVDRFTYFRDTIPFDQLIWFRQTISLKDPYGSGYSPTYASDMYSDLEDKFVTLQDQILGLGPMPRVVATAKDPMMAPGRDEAIAFKQDMKRQQSGSNAGGLYVNTGAWDFTPMTYAPADLSGMDLSEYDMYRMASIFDQPPTYYTVDTNLANLQAADEQHAKMGIEPRCTRIAGTLTDFVRMFDERLFFAFDSCLREDEQQKAQIIDMALKNGSITINQANLESQWPPAPYGDEPWMSNSLVQPSMAMEAHEQKLEQGDQALQQSDAEMSDSALKQTDEGDDEGDDKGGSEARALAEARQLLRSIGDELTLYRKGKGNPNHVPSGPHGGEFTSGGGAGATKAHGKHYAKRQRKKKKHSVKTKTNEKPKPTRGKMAAARREGKGKDARIVMADGSPAPAHVTPSMVPPQWTDVKVSIDPKAEVLVTARDAKGRPKMVTSKSYDARSAAVKFNRVSEMIKEHDKIGGQIEKARQSPTTKEEADVAWLMREQGTRPGSDRDTKAKVKAYGATTLEARHVVEAPGGVRLQFIGKEGIAHDHLVRNPKLAKMLMDRKVAAASPDARLFSTSDSKVRDFTATLDGGKFSPKDFRTSLATRMATDHVKADPVPSTNEKEHKARVMAVAKRVSGVLGNRPAQALESYIHPASFASWSPRT